MSRTRELLVIQCNAEHSAVYMRDLLFYKALYPSGILHLDESCRQKTD